MPGPNITPSPAKQAATQESPPDAKQRRDTFVRCLPKNVQQGVAQLEGLDDQVATLERQFQLERRQLERKFESLYAPILAQRAQCIEGRGAGEHPVPDFWIGTMKAETAVAGNVTAKDEPALKSLRDVTCSTLQEANGVGFCLQFYFTPNRYFSNQILAKTYHLSGTDTEPVLERAEGTDISWKPGMSLTQSKSGPCLSFFRFFDTLRISSDPAMVNQVAEWIEGDYEVGRAFKDKLVPHAVRWFTGERDDSEDFRSDGAGDAEEAEGAADELEAARFELALNAAVASPEKASPTTSSFKPEPRWDK